MAAGLSVVKASLLIFLLLLTADFSITLLELGDGYRIGIALLALFVWAIAVYRVIAIGLSYGIEGSRWHRGIFIGLLGAATMSLVPLTLGWILPSGLGTDWEARPDDDFGETSIVTAVGADPTGFAALGLLGDDSAGWISDDALTWNSVSLETSAFDDASVRSFAFTDTGLVAAGYVGDVFAVWTSEDIGQSWTRELLVASPEFDDAEVVDVAVSISGFLAIGESKGAPAAWTSADGKEWTPTLLITADFAGASIVGLEATQQGFLATGVMNDGRDSGPDVFWTSQDGQRWDRFDLPEAVFEAAFINSVVAAPRGYFVFGSIEDELAVWSSIDGIKWDRSLLPSAVFGDAFITGVTSTPDGLLAVGVADGSTAIWEWIPGED